MTTQPNDLQTVTDVQSAPERVREAVVDAARSLFAERGIHAVSVREIAREVGVSHTLLHLYFGSKEEIVRQVLSRADGSAAAGIIEGEQIDTAIGRVFRDVASDPAIVKVLGAALVEGIVPDRVHAPGVAREALIKKLEGETGELDPRIVSALVSSAVIGWAISSEWLLADAGIPDSEYATAVDQAAIVLERLVRSCG